MTIAFTKTKAPFGWCSNMSGFRIVDEAGVEWRTAEHLFQAMRFTDPTIREAIRTTGSPMAAKFLAIKHTKQMTVVPRGEQDVANMLKVLRLKIAQHPNLRVELLSTGDQLIVEDVTNRPHGSGKFWGAALDDGQWKGDNTLGKLWMQIRGECWIEDNL